MKNKIHIIDKQKQLSEHTVLCSKNLQIEYQ